MPRNSRCQPCLHFWIPWFLCYYAFQVLLSMHFEARYFVFAVPPVAALVCCTWIVFQARGLPRFVFGTLVLFVIICNCASIVHLPRGLVGHEEVAIRLAEEREPGNVLLCCWHASDMVFRYRCQKEALPRQFIRGDRSLVRRAPSYWGLTTEIIASDMEDVLHLVQDGRARYMVTCSENTLCGDDRTFDGSSRARLLEVVFAY